MLGSNIFGGFILVGLCTTCLKLEFKFRILNHWCHHTKSIVVHFCILNIKDDKLEKHDPEAKIFSAVWLIVYRANYYFFNLTCISDILRRENSPNCLNTPGNFNFSLSQVFQIEFFFVFAIIAGLPP